MNIKIVVLFVAAAFSLSGAAYSIEETFKIGHGRYLSQEEVKDLFIDISRHADKKFKNLYYKYLGNSVHEVISYNAENTLKYKVIEFVKVEKWYSINSKDSVLYYISVNGHESVPKEEIERREDTEEKYYDIWVISGYYVTFEKSADTGEYNFVQGGGAE